MCVRHANASISTGFPFTLRTIFSKKETEVPPLPPGLIPRLTMLGPLLGSLPYLAIGIFSAVNPADFLFLSFVVLFCGFCIGVIPAFLGAVMFVEAMRRVSTPDLGAGLMAGFLCGAFGAAVTLVTFILLMSATAEMRAEVFLEALGYGFLQGGIPGAILGAIEGRKLGRDAGTDTQEVKPLQ